MPLYKLYRRVTGQGSFDWCIGIDADSNISVYAGPKDGLLRQTVYPPKSDGQPDLVKYESLTSDIGFDGYDFLHDSVRITKGKLVVPDAVSGSQDGYAYHIPACTQEMVDAASKIAEVMAKEGCYVLCDVLTHENNIVINGCLTYPDSLPSSRSKYAKPLEGMIPSTCVDALFFLVALKHDFDVSLVDQDAKEVDGYLGFVSQYHGDIPARISRCAENLDLVTWKLTSLPGTSFYF